MVVLGLGSNRGDRLGYLRDAIHRIQYALPASQCPDVLNGVEVTAISPLYESDALLPTDAPKDWDQPFLNVNILCKTNLSPAELLQLLKGIEAQVGRKARGRWAPREIDIDILIMGDLNYKSASLQIPHPGLLERPFALLPLADLIPNWVIPIPGRFQGMSVGQYVGSWKRNWVSVQASGHRPQLQQNRNQKAAFVPGLAVACGLRPERLRNWETIPFRTRRSLLNVTELVGVLNITPDSFSDGGLYGKTESALRQIHTLILNGIRIIDIGGESTRPNATLLDTEEEWHRILPILEAIQTARKDSEKRNAKEKDSTPFSSLFSGQDVRFSVDTRNPEVASRSIRLGVDWINDVSGFASDAMKEAVLGSQSNHEKAEKLVKIVVMHSLSVPPKKSEILSPAEDPIKSLIDWAETRIKDLNQFGIERSRIIFDPGLGFGKTPEQSWEILRRAHEFHKLRVPILFGHSRKSFLTPLTAARLPQERDIETTALSVELAKKGINYLRVHNGEQNARGLKTWAQIDGVCRW